MKHSAALPVAWITLRVMIFLVLMFFACDVALLICSFVDQRGTIKLLGLAGLPQSEQSLSGMRAIAVVGLLTAPINYAVLKCLLDMVETVRSGDPFVGENARRLKVIAWLMVVLELGSLVESVTGKAIWFLQHSLYLDTTTVVNGWLVVLLTFVLARVFAAGALMREDLEGTV
jgi:ABC-type transport system involved in multi-copper enzyme maturation permease subunit